MVYCIGDKLPSGVRFLSHSELESPHYQAIRTNSAYRIEWNRLEWESRQDSPHSLPEAPKEEPTPVRKPQRISHQLDEIKGRLNHLQNKLYDHLDFSKKKKYQTIK